jgi:hypothetical protein
MCSDSGQAASNDMKLSDAQTKLTQTLDNNYSTAFSEQQNVLARVQSQMQAQIANPMGYTDQQLATAKTSINENTATAARQALGAAGAFAAAHGGADVGSGPTGEIAGQIVSGAAQAKAGELAQLSNQNQAFKQANYWNAIQGLSATGSQYGGGASTASGSSSSVANSGANAGQAAITASNTGFQDVLGGISALGGVAASGASAFQDIKNT